MELTQFVEQNFPIQCKGRDPNGKEVLGRAADAVVNMHQSPGSNVISSSVTCPYNTGSHGERCKASRPKFDQVGKGIVCPYSLDIPYALEKR
jgi:hypothetical protein